MHSEIMRLCAANRIATVIETGTLYGVTTQAFADMVRNVITIDVNPTFQPLTQHPNVTALVGDSARVMDQVMPTLQRPALFFLDAHDAGLNVSCVLEELRVIARYAWKESVIAIHDFKVEGKDFGFDTYNGLPLDLEYIRVELKWFFENGFTTRFNTQAEGDYRGVMFIEPKTP